MSNVESVLSTMARIAAQEKKEAAAFVGPKTASAVDVRVDDIIAFRDRYNGHRYTGRVLALGDGFHVGSLQMRVQVYSFNGAYTSGPRDDENDCVNVAPEELLAIIRNGGYL